MPLNDHQDRVLLEFQGATAAVLKKGATCISWKSSDEKERLFLSSKADIQGSKGVRGGIPVVFPFFGPQTRDEHKGLSQHGFARTSIWTFESNESFENEDGVFAVFTLDNYGVDQNTKNVYPRPFHLKLIVRLNATLLATKIHVTNRLTSQTDFKGSKNLAFQALFHSYLLISDSDTSENVVQTVEIPALCKQPYLDKTSSDVTVTRTDKSGAVFNPNGRQTDSVYMPAQSEKYIVTWEGGALEISTVNLPQVVVWNPGESSSMADMEENGWKRFVCVEPGHVSDFIEISPGEVWTAKMMLEIQKSTQL